VYTTIQLLKEQEACRDGFATVLSYFGGAKANHETVIPLHALLLVSGFEDTLWALANAAIIDPIQFEEFKQKWAVQLFWAMLSDSSSVYRYATDLLGGPIFSSETLSRTLKKVTTKKKTQRSLIEKISSIKSYTDLRNFISECRQYTFSSPFWENVVNSQVWDIPGQFLARILKLCSTEGRTGVVPLEYANEYLFQPKYVGGKDEIMRAASLLSNDDPFGWVTQIPCRKGSQITMNKDSLSIRLPREKFQQQVLLLQMHRLLIENPNLSDFDPVVELDSDVKEHSELKDEATQTLRCTDPVRVHGGTRREVSWADDLYSSPARERRAVEHQLNPITITDDSGKADLTKDDVENEDEL
jgi:hypothetical protein